MSFDSKKYGEGTRYKLEPAPTSTCPLCKGTGQRDVVSFVDSGKTVKNSCSVCKGKGVLPSDREPATALITSLGEQQAMTSPDEPQTPRTAAVWEKVWADDFDGSLPDTLYDFARQLELELRGSRRIIDELGVELRKAQERIAVLEDDLGMPPP